VLLIAFTPLLLDAPLASGTSGRHNCIVQWMKTSSLARRPEAELRRATGFSASGVDIVSSTLIFLFSGHPTQRFKTEGRIHLRPPGERQLFLAGKAVVTLQQPLAGP
jgi:hypothetical protein